MPNVDRKVSLIYESRTYRGSISTIQQNLRANLKRDDLHGTVAFLLRAVPYGGPEYQRLDAIFYRIIENDREQLGRGMFLAGRHEFQIGPEIEEVIHRLPFFLGRTTDLDQAFLPGKPFNPLVGPKPQLLRTVVFVGVLGLLWWYFSGPSAGTSLSEPLSEVTPIDETLKRVPESYGKENYDEPFHIFIQNHPHYLQLASLPSLRKAHMEWERLNGADLGLDIFYVLMNPTKLGEKEYTYRVVKFGFASRAAAQAERTSGNWKQPPIIKTIVPIPNCGSSVCIQEHFQQVQQEGISYYQHLE